MTSEKLASLLPSSSTAMENYESCTAKMVWDVNEDADNMIVFMRLEFRDNDESEFAAIAVDPTSLTITFTFNEVLSRPAVYLLVFKFLNRRRWIYYNIDIEKLENMFRNAGEQVPVAKSKVDSRLWFRENFPEINETVKDLATSFNATTKIYAPRERRHPKTTEDCLLLFETVKAAVGANIVSELMKGDEEVDDVESEADDSVDVKGRKATRRKEKKRKTPNFEAEDSVDVKGRKATGCGKKKKK